MKCFQDLFMANNGSPITYKGKKLQISDKIPVSDSEKLRVVFERVNSSWRQGIRLRMLEGGFFVIDGKELKSKYGIVFWNDTAPEIVHVTIRTRKGRPENVLVYNVWDVGDGLTEVGHNGAAIHVEEIENGRRYHCNDGHPDDDLNDLIFRIERVQED